MSCYLKEHYGITILLGNQWKQESNTQVKTYQKYLLDQKKLFLIPNCQITNIFVSSIVSATLDEPTPVFQRGGTIVPTLQRVRRSTKIMMNDPYTLIVALDENGKAKGHIYMDDGQSFKVIKLVNRQNFLNSCN